MDNILVTQKTGEINIGTPGWRNGLILTFDDK